MYTLQVFVDVIVMCTRFSRKGTVNNITCKVHVL